MGEPNARLVNDLARLVVKYKASDWNRLLDWVDDEKRRAQLRQLLVELGGASKEKRRANGPKKRKPSGTKKVREALVRIRKDDADRADLLDDIWLKLRQRELLPTIGSVRAFAEAMGTKGLNATRRDQAVTELMERLLPLPIDALEERMRQTVVEDRSLGDEYERWVGLILRPPGS
ncbi:MAG TPA: hypothetical protein VK471_08540 [Solirubrobacterales bacterium]|nr:hypothetical protein [Solirubrobacterales bacterium]